MLIIYTFPTLIRIIAIKLQCSLSIAIQTRICIKIQFNVLLEIANSLRQFSLGEATQRVKLCVIVLLIISLTILTN